MQDTAPLLGNYQYATLENGIQEPIDSKHQSEVSFYKRVVVGLFVVIGTLSVVLVSGATGGLKPFYSLFQTSPPPLGLPARCGFTGSVNKGQTLVQGECIASNRSFGSTVNKNFRSTKYQGFFRALLDSDGDLKVFVIDIANNNYANYVLQPPTADVPVSIFRKTPRKKLSSAMTNFLPVPNSKVVVDSQGATVYKINTNVNTGAVSFSSIYNSQTGTSAQPALNTCKLPELRMQYDRNLIFYCNGKDSNSGAKETFSTKDACAAGSSQYAWCGTTE